MSGSTTTSPGRRSQSRQRRDPPLFFRYIAASQLPRRPHITVSIDGYQHADGHAVRYIVVDTVHTDNPLPPNLARSLIAAWTAAADEVGKMASRDVTIA